MFGGPAEKGKKKGGFLYKRNAGSQKEKKDR